MLKEFIELRALRLDRGWTYRTLNAEVNKVSPSHVSLSCLHGLLNDEQQSPNELTLDGIRKFLQHTKKLAKRAKRARRQERLAS